MNATLSRLTATAARAAAAFAAALTLASCGGGGVSANPSPIVDSPTLTILPATAVMYPGLPTTFVLSGGTGAYIVTSSNQAILPISGGVTGRSVTLVPNPVTADTTVTLTLRDTGSAAPVTATVTVRPGTVNNDLTITPSATQDPSCSPAVCSGTDAQAKVTISQGGIPLAARGVRFQVVNGSFSFVESPPLSRFEIPGVPTSLITTTDETGTARATIAVTALVPNQTATVRVTDLGSGAYREATFAIAQYTGNSPAFFTLPSSITFTGPYTDVCASGASSQVAIFGGVPPYTVVGGSSAFSVLPGTVPVRGGTFNVTLAPVPVCLENAPIGVTDATGRTITVTVSSKAGTGTAPLPEISLLPSTLNLRCAQAASVVVTGGSDPFAVSSDHPRITAVVAAASPRTITITRTGGDGGVNYPQTASVAVTDGTRRNTVAINIVNAEGTASVTSCP